MTTYAELQEKVSEAIQDPDNQTFTEASVRAMIASSWADISRIAPRRFTEDITPVADTLEYQVLADDFPVPNDDIELFSVEVWDGSATPNLPLRLIEPASKHPMGLSYSQAGWRFWGGMLTIPNRHEESIDPATDILRVMGYSPWPLPVEDEDVVPFSQVVEEALVIRCFIETLRRLIGNRTLFTQWQTRSNNSDISPAALMNDKAQAEEEWRKLSRAIQVTREAP